MQSVLNPMWLFVFAALVSDVAVARVPGRSIAHLSRRLTGPCPGGGRMYPCFMWPCWRWKCEDPPGLTCVADYCTPGCGIKWQDESQNEVPCEIPVRRTRDRGK